MLSVEKKRNTPLIDIQNPLFCKEQSMKKFNHPKKKIWYAASAFLLLGVFLLCSFTSKTKTLSTAKASGIKVVVIDAGHGGHDPGCQYGGANEKKVTLAIALKLGKIIKENCKDVKVIYTRDKDEFIELHERAAIANRNKADVFISIHCNANKSTGVHGTETYTMGPHKNDDNLEVAKRENDVVLMEDDYEKNYDGFDPKSPEAEIIFSLYQSAHIEQSMRLARHVEKQLKTTVKRTSRGVKQAGFLVLWKTSMPSILVETGFLSNASERKYITSEAGQKSIANGIYEAFRKFKDESEATSK
jgi:N-acetylmuramoyl-L-alanine amidase